MASESAIRLGIFATHPIQYHVPLWRKLASMDDLDVRVYYASDLSLRGEVDPGFGRPVKWDVPLLEGYESRFLHNRSKNPGPENGFRGLNCPETGRIIREGGFDAILIHGYSHLFEWQVFRAAWRSHVPILLRGDCREGAGIRKGALLEMIRGTILRLLYRRIAVGLSVGKYMRRHFSRLGMPDERIVDCPHCIDSELAGSQRDQWQPRRKALREELGIGAEDIVLLFCGKFCTRKNPLLIPRALEQIDHKRFFPVFVDAGELTKELETSLDKVCPGRYAMPGFVNQSMLGKYYVLSDLMVLPSFKETWGLVVNEAMEYGLPCIVSDRVGCREDLVIPGETGYIIPSDDAEALAGVLAEIADDPEKLKPLSARSAEHIRNFSSDRAVEGIRKGLHVIRQS